MKFRLYTSQINPAPFHSTSTPSPAVHRFVQMSSINAREQPDTAFLKGGSKYQLLLLLLEYVLSFLFLLGAFLPHPRWLASKYQGELAVRSEFPEATIFRAADV